MPASGATVSSSAIQYQFSSFTIRHLSRLEQPCGLRSLARSTREHVAQVGAGQEDAPDAAADDRAEHRARRAAVAVRDQPNPDDDRPCPSIAVSLLQVPLLHRV